MKKKKVDIKIGSRVKVLECYVDDLNHVGKVGKVIKIKTDKHTGEFLYYWLNNCAASKVQLLKPRKSKKKVSKKVSKCKHNYRLITYKNAFGVGEILLKGWITFFCIKCLQIKTKEI